MSIKRQFIDTEELTDYILEYIYSEDFKKAFLETQFAYLPDEISSKCEEAMRHGMNWAALLLNTSEINHYYGSVNDE